MELSTPILKRMKKEFLGEYRRKGRRRIAEFVRIF